MLLLYSEGQGLEKDKCKIKEKAGDFYRLKEKRVEQQRFNTIQSLKLGTKSHLRCPEVSKKSYRAGRYDTICGKPRLDWQLETKQKTQVASSDSSLTFRQLNFACRVGFSLGSDLLHFSVYVQVTPPMLGAQLISV